MGCWPSARWSPPWRSRRPPARRPAPHAAAPALAADAGTCHLGNGVQHVINITFDNVHFFRDNPNVPSDLEQMPTLYSFLKRNGTVLSNMHTPLIAHTAEDSLAIYSGLYGDRHGQPVSNTYHTYKPDGTVEADTSFVYWTSPVITTARVPSTNDTQPSMVYSPTVPARNTAPGRSRPSRGSRSTRPAARSARSRPRTWCSRTTATSPPSSARTAGPAPYANTTSAFIGEAVHCGLGDATCENADGGT